MKAQRGIAAILLLLIIAMAAVAALTKDIWVGETRAYQKQITQNALQQAKQALLNYVEVGAGGYSGGNNSALQPSTFTSTTNGRLPCTDQNGDGITGASSAFLEAPCGSYQSGSAAGFHSLGLFPWSTLQQTTLQDAYHQCLWYAVDGLFKINTKTTSAPVNSDSPGSFSIFQPVKSISSAGVITWSEKFIAGNPINPTTGVAILNPSTQVVAVIISPGAVGGTQTQTPYIGSGGAQPCPLTAQGLGSGAGSPSAEQSAPYYLKNYTGPTTGLVFNNNTVVSNQTGTPLTANLGVSTSTAYKYFLTADTNEEQLNDQFAWITAEEFSEAATKGIAQTYVNAIKAYALNNGAFPPAASYPGGSCTPGLLQGFVPYTCGSGGTSLQSYMPKSLYNVGLTAVLDPDMWGGLGHYAVSIGCLTSNAPNCASLSTHIPVGTTNGVVTNFSTLATTPVTTANIQALILMRGRALANQYTSGVSKCINNETSSNIGTSTALSDISPCIEDATTSTAVSKVFTSISGSVVSPIYLGGPYNVPSPVSSNDYMIMF